jgi:hypothetical protein
MKQTAVEWLELRYKTNINLMDYDFKQAKEMEKQQNDDFAIGFAKWCFEKYNTISCYDMEELLEIYKKEKGL